MSNKSRPVVAGVPNSKFLPKPKCPDQKVSEEALGYRRALLMKHPEAEHWPPDMFADMVHIHSGRLAEAALSGNPTELRFHALEIANYAMGCVRAVDTHQE